MLSRVVNIPYVVKHITHSWLGSQKAQGPWRAHNIVLSQDPPAGVSPPSECWTASRSDSVVSRRRPPLAASCHRHCNKVELSTCGCDAGAAGLLQTQRRGWGAKRHRPYNCTSGLTVHSPPPRRRGTTGVETAVEGEGEGERGREGERRRRGRVGGRKEDAPYTRAEFVCASRDTLPLSTGRCP